MDILGGGTKCGGSIICKGSWFRIEGSIIKGTGKQQQDWCHSARERNGGPKKVTFLGTKILQYVHL